ncbi:MAG: hypothetical protein LBL65_03205 [Campylobacteraceae bacterium]|jgi:hypothetical protein|nr:hypothetical protein [Campylobacteraceae bacterium]
MKKLFLLLFAVVSFISADISDKDFENAKTSQVCKKILDTGDFVSHIDSFVFYSDNNKTKRFLSVFFEKDEYVVYSDELPMDTNENEYIERGGVYFSPKTTKIDFEMTADELHFATMFLTDNTPYMCYFSDSKRYIFQYDKKIESFKEACMIEQVGEYEYK